MKAVICDSKNIENPVWGKTDTNENDRAFELTSLIISFTDIWHLKLRLNFKFYKALLYYAKKIPEKFRIFILT